MLSNRETRFFVLYCLGFTFGIQYVYVNKNVTIEEAWTTCHNVYNGSLADIKSIDTSVLIVHGEQGEISDNYWHGVFEKTTNWITFDGCYEETELDTKRSTTFTSVAQCQAECGQEPDTYFSVGGKVCLCNDETRNYMLTINRSNCDTDCGVLGLCKGNSTQVNIYRNVVVNVKEGDIDKNLCLGFKCYGPLEFIAIDCNEAHYYICVFPAECSYSSAIYVRQFNYNAITAVSSSSQLQSTVVLGEDSCYIHCAQTQQCTSFTYNTATTECILYSGYLDTPPLSAAASNYYITKDASICSNMGYTYDEAIRLCYKFHYDKSTDQGAKLTCVGEGGRLFRIDSSKKQRLVAAFPITENGRYRIDGRRLNDIWLLSNGSELSYTNWGSGMPRTGTKGCLTIHLPSANWMNSSCDNEKRYICERSL